LCALNTLIHQNLYAGLWHDFKANTSVAINQELYVVLVCYNDLYAPICGGNNNALRHITTIPSERIKNNKNMIWSSAGVEPLAGNETLTLPE
jgi:hypothetical protein